MIFSFLTAVHDIIITVTVLYSAWIASQARGSTIVNLRRGICFTATYSVACNQTAEVEELQVAIGFLRCTDRVVVVSVIRPLKQFQDFDEAQTFLY